MDASIRIRTAEKSDAVGMKTCVEAAYRHYIPRMGKPPGPMLDDYVRVTQQHRAFVAEDNGEIVGVLVLIRAKSGILLDNVAVHPGHQGKGLGRRFLELAESEARSQGYTFIDLYTHECMIENIGMYKAFGYVETGRKTEHGYNRVYMRKALS